MIHHSNIKRAGRDEREPSRNMRVWRRPLAIFLLCALGLAVHALLSVAYTRSITPAGPPFEIQAPRFYAWWVNSELFIGMLILVGGIGAIVVAFVSLVEVIISVYRRVPVPLPVLERLAGSATVLVVITLLLVGPRPWIAVWKEGLEAAAVRVEPLVVAVERYERANGAPPDSLSDLVPVFLAELPPHPIRGCGSLKYFRDDRKPGTGSGWSLYMSCPKGLLQLDSFYYRSDGAYPTGGSFYRIGRWVYHVD